VLGLGFPVAVRLRPMSHLRFYREISSRNFIARQNCKCDMACRANFLLIGAVIYSVQLCRKNAVNADWSILVYATKLQCATRHVTLATLSRDKVARQSCAIKLQV